MRLYRTGLWCDEPRRPVLPGAGQGWAIRPRGGTFTGTDEEFEQLQEQMRARFGMPPIVINPPRPGPGRKTFTFSNEVLVLAGSRLAAQRVVNLITACVSALDGVEALEPDQVVAVPEAGGDFEDLRVFGGQEPRGSELRSPQVGIACSMACKASRRRDRQYALFKLQQSYHSFSLDLIEYHPAYSPRQFGVEKDPARHVQLASAITLAYSAIEELQLEIRASDKRPALLRDGSFNPVVREDVEARLQAAGIDIKETQVWNLRGPATRIERRRKVDAGVKATWSRRAVRDRELSIADALRLASWLRSKVTTHRFNENSQSLTAYDAVNVQQLARRLILEHLGAFPAG